VLIETLKSTFEKYEVPLKSENWTNEKFITTLHLNSLNLDRSPKVIRLYRLQTNYAMRFFQDLKRGLSNNKDITNLQVFYISFYSSADYLDPFG
jgi:hypothetical protein